MSLDPSSSPPPEPDPTRAFLSSAVLLIDYPVSAFRLYAIAEGWKGAIEALTAEAARYEATCDERGANAWRASVVATEECLAQVKTLLAESIPTLAIRQS